VAARIPLDHHEVSVLDNGDGTDTIGLAEISSTIDSAMTPVISVQFVSDEAWFTAD
jgi:hypothetical protein